MPSEAPRDRGYTRMSEEHAAPSSRLTQPWYATDYSLYRGAVSYSKYANYKDIYGF